MSVKAPVYASQKKKAPKPSSGFTKVSVQEECPEDPNLNSIFWLQILILTTLVVGGGYIIYKGVPMRIK